MFKTFGKDSLFETSHIKEIGMDKKTLKNFLAALVLATLLFSIMPLPLPSLRVMATTSIISISPTGGEVGTTIRVDGTIDTVNGTFKVRWNQTLNITSGISIGNNVNASFVVPPTAGAISGRNVTVELIDTSTNAVAPANFTLFTKFSMAVSQLPPPKQLQEGQTIPISVNVTGGEPNTVYTANMTVKNPANQTYSGIASLPNTASTGSAGRIQTYPTDFHGASTNYTGNYLVAFNGTIARDHFFVGLTDKSEYRRNETVKIQAAGYNPSEVVKAIITFGESPLPEFPKNLTALTSGIVNSSWAVPFNATRGMYTLALINATSKGIEKAPSDNQTFEILGTVCQVQGKNLAGEAVKDAVVEVYNVTKPGTAILDGSTNSTGWIRFNLDSGHYTFKGFFNDVEVGEEDRTLTADTVLNLTLTLRLVNVVATVKTTTGEGVPLIDIALKYNYTTIENQNISQTTYMKTNLTGIAIAQNLFNNTMYRVEARRYGMLFSNTTLSIQTPISPVQLDLTLPSYTINLHVLDSKGLDANGIQIDVYDFASGITAALESAETNSSGDAPPLTLPLGIYVLRAFKDGVFLNETQVNLNKSLSFAFNLDTANLDVKVFTLDYFGQPIASANVTIERKTDSGYVLVDEQLTGASGSIVFPSIIGGDCRVSVYIAGALLAVKTQFLGANSNQLTFRIGRYVAVLGHPIEAGLFAWLSFIIVLIVVVLVLVRRPLVKASKKLVKR